MSGGEVRPADRLVEWLEFVARWVPPKPSPYCQCGMPGCSDFGRQS